MKSVQRAGVASPAAVFARPNGSVLDLPDFRAAADDGWVSAADPRDFIPLPEGALLLTLPGRSVVAYDGAVQTIVGDVEAEEANAVAAALPLGYTRTLLPAFAERPGAPPLPLYGYAAVAWDGDRFCVGAIKTDELETWSPAAHAPASVREGIAARKTEFPGNSLIEQLALCATEYGCFTAQNVFLRAGEAAIPVSPACNARCIGCISEQEPDAGIESAQARVRRAPSIEEITEVAVAHFASDPDGIVSFGQGCEGEPLLAAPRIAKAIGAIRSRTRCGTIHCNTNASLPQALTQLIEAGLQSVRISLNSARAAAYAAYYRPRQYSFADVRASMRVAAERGAAISLNLLTHPGVTDDADEMEAFGELLRDVPVAMVQTRTLNVDPARYLAAVGRPKRKPLGMRAWLRWLRHEFPNVRVGNFTRGFG
jgi:wyosine [tRNA(Phe)-imidazoG37] synthetase (radical SAM superfamily)